MTGTRTQMSRPARPTRRAAAACAAALLTVAVSACGNANPDEITWTKVKTQEIVEIDDSAGVYVTGSFTLGTGDVDSETKIDYKFARKVEGGGLRQQMVSDYYAKLEYTDADGLRHSTHGGYPGSEIVTIHQDVDRPSETPRVEVYECSTDGHFKGCVMPDGGDMSGASHRIDIHVPAGTVVDAKQMTENRSS